MTDETEKAPKDYRTRPPDSGQALGSFHYSVLTSTHHGYGDQTFSFNGYCNPGGKDWKGIGNPMNPGPDPDSEIPCLSYGNPAFGFTGDHRSQPMLPSSDWAFPPLPSPFSSPSPMMQHLVVLEQMYNQKLAEYLSARDDWFSSHYAAEARLHGASRDSVTTKPTVSDSPAHKSFIDTSLKRKPETSTARHNSEGKVKKSYSIQTSQSSNNSAELAVPIDDAHNVPPKSHAPSRTSTPELHLIQKATLSLLQLLQSSRTESQLHEKICVSLMLLLQSSNTKSQLRPMTSIAESYPFQHSTASLSASDCNESLTGSEDSSQPSSPQIYSKFASEYPGSEPQSEDCRVSFSPPKQSLADLLRGISIQEIRAKINDAHSSGLIRIKPPGSISLADFEPQRFASLLQRIQQLAPPASIIDTTEITVKVNCAYTIQCSSDGRKKMLWSIFVEGDQGKL